MKRNISVLGKAVGLVLAAALLPLVAHAADDKSGVYATLAVGYTKASVDTGGCGSACTVDDTDTAFSGGVGYRFSKNIAVESGYTRLGKFSWSSGGLTTSEKVDGGYLGVVKFIPISPDIDLSATVGDYFWRGDVSCNFVGCSHNENQDSLFYGVGAAYNVAKEVSIGLNWNHYRLNTSNLSYVDVLSARFQYQF